MVQLDYRLMLQICAFLALDKLVFILICWFLHSRHVIQNDMNGLYMSFESVLHM